jgi:beta-glucosidase
VGVAGTATKVLYAQGIPTLVEMVRDSKFTTDESGMTPGVRAEYFASDDLSGAAVINRVEPFVGIGIESGYPEYPENTASVRWTGFFSAADDGTFDLVVASAGDGGGYYRVFVDDVLVLDSWTLNKAIADYATLPLRAGTHKVVLEQRGRQKWPGARLWLAISRHGSRVTDVAKRMAAEADLVVVAAGFDHVTESEGADRTFRLPPGQDELINAIADANAKTVVVMNSGGAADMNAWIDRVPALLQAWYPGQEGGTAIAEILFGLVNPSGRLPATFERHWEDNPSHDAYYPEPGTLAVRYREGIFVGYRGFDSKNVDVLFPFGHGLGYTTFAYGALSISPARTRDGKVEVSFDLTNTGKRAGAEVAQVYVADPHSGVPRPSKELKGFVKVELQPGETRRVSVGLDRRALAYYDVAARSWRVEPGTFEILVARSSRDIVLRGNLTYTHE